MVFPSGAVRKHTGRKKVPESWYVSYGINDHTIVVAEHSDLALGDPTFATWGRRYFMTENGSAPVRVWDAENQPPRFIRWERANGGSAGQTNGVMTTSDPRLALLLRESGGAREIDEAEYLRMKTKA